MSERLVEFPGGGQIVLRAADADLTEPTRRPLPRLCFAAAHVAMRPGYRELGHTPDRPGTPNAIAEWIDLSATMALRRRIAGFGFGIAEAMDTAQRFEIGWPAARQLIEACGALALPEGFVAGASCDQLTVPDPSRTERIDAIIEQTAIIRAAGGSAVLLPQPWLCTQNISPDGWVAFYEDIVREAEGPLLIHWLGEMFHPGMRGAFPGDSFSRIMALDPQKIRGCKLSLLDATFEVKQRQALAANRQLMFTGDDFHFGALMIGDGSGHDTEHAPFGSRQAGLGAFSHALLGILDGIARPASAALHALDTGDVATCREIMDRCERVGQAVFEAPTQFYKSGLAFLAWLNGWQTEFVLPNGAERTRGLDHLRRVLETASAAGVLEDIDLAADRLAAWRPVTSSWPA